MTQDTEKALREVVENHLELYPLRETVYIKIVQNRVMVANTIEELDTLTTYPEGDLQ
jgi:hypothetical protein